MRDVNKDQMFERFATASALDPVRHCFAFVRPDDPLRKAMISFEWLNCKMFEITNVHLLLFIA